MIRAARVYTTIKRYSPRYEIVDPWDERILEEIRERYDKYVETHIGQTDKHFEEIYDFISKCVRQYEKFIGTDVEEKKIFKGIILYDDTNNTMRVVDEYQY